MLGWHGAADDGVPVHGGNTGGDDSDSYTGFSSADDEEDDVGSSGGSPRLTVMPEVQAKQKAAEEGARVVSGRRSYQEQEGKGGNDATGKASEEEDDVEARARQLYRALADSPPHVSDDAPKSGRRAATSPPRSLPVSREVSKGGSEREDLHIKRGGGAQAGISPSPIVTDDSAEPRAAESPPSRAAEAAMSPEDAVPIALRRGSAGGRRAVHLRHRSREMEDLHDMSDGLRRKLANVEGDAPDAGRVISVDDSVVAAQRLPSRGRRRSSASSGPRAEPGDADKLDEALGGLLAGLRADVERGALGGRELKSTKSESVLTGYARRGSDSRSAASEESAGSGSASGGEVAVSPVESAAQRAGRRRMQTVAHETRDDPLSGRALVMRILQARLTTMRVLRHLWHHDDVGAAIARVAATGEDPVSADFCAAVGKTKLPRWPEDVSWSEMLCPVLATLLKSEFEECVAARVPPPPRCIPPSHAILWAPRDSHVMAGLRCTSQLVSSLTPMALAVLGERPSSGRRRGRGGEAERERPRARDPEEASRALAQCRSLAPQLALVGRALDPLLAQEGELRRLARANLAGVSKVLRAAGHRDR